MYAEASLFSKRFLNFACRHCPLDFHRRQSGQPAPDGTAMDNAITPCTTPLFIHPKYFFSVGWVCGFVLPVPSVCTHLYPLSVPVLTYDQPFPQLLSLSSFQVFPPHSFPYLVLSCLDLNIHPSPPHHGLFKALKMYQLERRC